MKRFLPIIWFYIGWFGCVFLAKHGHSEWSLLFPAVLIAALLIFKELDLKLSITLVLLATAGVAFDIIMSSFNFIGFSQSDSVMPTWLISIWILFVLVIPNLVSPFLKRLWLASALAAVMGPLSYTSGKALGVLYVNGKAALFLYAIFWALYFPLCIYIVDKNVLVQKT